MHKLSLLFFAVAVLFPAFSHSEDSSNKENQYSVQKSHKFINFDDKLSIRLFSNPTTFMTLSMSKNDETVRYKSNHRTAFGLGLSYNGYGISILAVKNSQYAQDEDKCGKSKYHDLNISKYGKHIGGDFFFRRYSGMFIENYPSSLPRNGKKRSDVKLTFIGCYINYTLFEEFSFNEILKQSERRLGFSWSPLVGVYYDYFNFTSDGNLIPQDRREDFPEFLQINSSSYSGGGILAGIGAKYCFTIKIYVSASLSFGYGKGQLKMKAEDNSSKIASNSKAIVKLALGFNGDKFGCGIIGSSEESIYRINGSASITPFANYIEIFLLFRF